MNKDELIAKMLEVAKGEVTKADGRRMLDALIVAIEGAVADGKEVQLVGFGSFKKAHRNAREGRNPRTGEAIHIDARDVPRFNAGKRFKDMVAK